MMKESLSFYSTTTVVILFFSQWTASLSFSWLVTLWKTEHLVDDSNGDKPSIFVCSKQMQSQRLENWEPDLQVLTFNQQESSFVSPVKHVLHIWELNQTVIVKVSSTPMPSFLLPTACPLTIRS